MAAVRRASQWLGVDIDQIDPYWSWLADRLRLTVGGRIAFTAVLLVTALAACVGVIGAFYNVQSGRDPDVTLSFQVGFGLVVIAVCASVILGAITALDAAFRGLRWSFRRFATRLAKPS